MKISTLLLASLFLITLLSCSENSPVIPEGTVIDTDRKVVIEEFTGVQCVGCPAGSAELKNLTSQAIYGDNLIPISIHTDAFGVPYAESKYDFRTDEGNELEQYLDAPQFYPSAVINRKDFNGGGYFLQQFLGIWSGLIEEELLDPVLVTVNLEHEYDSESRELNINTFGVVQEDIEGELRMTILIKESKVVDYQLTPDEGKKSDYEHNHILRKIITTTTGDAIVLNPLASQTYSLDYTYTIPEQYVPENCEIVAFVNLVSQTGPEKEVLQAESAHVIE